MARRCTSFDSLKRIPEFDDIKEESNEESKEDSKDKDSSSDSKRDSE